MEEEKEKEKEEQKTSEKEEVEDGWEVVEWGSSIWVLLFLDCIK